MGLVHVVLFRFPSPLDEADEKAMRSMVANFPSAIGLLRTCRFGKDLTGARTQGYQYLLDSEFDDFASMVRYREHPVHMEFLAWLNERSCEVIAFDFELNDETDFTPTV